METRKKRVLVVDDSATARLTLQRMLEAHGLIVDLAHSAEDALDYLSEARPDVIFMDHMMPGMDGLQAVKTIKDDPTTAMIPIMMYTSKGAGEVYVGQARALGAVGVLSKNVKPVELLKVLRALRMVKDPDDPNVSGIRRARATFVEHQAPAAPDETLKDAVKEAVVSCEVDALRRVITPLLQEQRVQFKRELAAATEALLKRIGATLGAGQRGRQGGRRDGRALRFGWLLAGVLMAVMVLDHVYWRGAGAPEPAQMVPTLAEQPGLIQDPGASGGGGAQKLVARENAGLYDVLGWALGYAGAYPYDEQPLGAHTLGLLQGLVSRLAAIGFRGTIRLDTHMGRFCLGRDAMGLPLLPQASAPMGECESGAVDHEEARLRGAQQSVAFANFLDSAPELARDQIRIELISHGLESPWGQPPGPDAVQSVGEWNRIAALNNRVGFTVIPQGH
jgi:CheY-like chemotaxis protein